MPGEERFQLGINTVAAVGLADKIEHGETILARSMSQSSTELLQEDGQALGGAAEQHRVDLRHIHPFTQFVHGKEEGNPAGFQVSQ